MKKIFFFSLGIFFCTTIFARTLELTVYNQNFALVKDQRAFNLKRGLNTIKFRDVAAKIEPESVHFNSLKKDNPCVILEQNYEYDLVSTDKLLDKYIDRDIRIITKGGEVYTGKLLSYSSSSLIITSEDGLRIIARPDNEKQIDLAKLPQGLITRPTLVWQLESAKSAKTPVEISYLTGGINWHCEYVAILEKDDNKIDLSGWVSINNQSGVSYKNAKLKLIAGEVKRAQALRSPLLLYRRKENIGGAQFKEKPFFEYHIYGLKRKTTLNNNQTKQISLLNAKGISVEKELSFDFAKGRQMSRYYSDAEKIKANARVVLRFRNSLQNHLGIPLPKGKIKVYKKDEDGSMQFIGEDAINHTSKGEELKLYLGDAFDITGQRIRKNYRKYGNTIEETYAIKINNHKGKAVAVKITEKLWRYANWEIVSASSSWKKQDASTIVFKIRIPKDSKAQINYTVRYWPD